MVRASIQSFRAGRSTSAARVVERPPKTSLGKILRRKTVQETTREARSPATSAFLHQAATALTHRPPALARSAAVAARAVARGIEVEVIAVIAIGVGAQNRAE